MGKRKSVTAEELMAQLTADPEYMGGIAKRDVELDRKAKELARFERPLLADLRAAGADIDSVWDLVNTRERYPKLVPVLLAHLKREYPDKIREGIARALAVPEARAGWKQLVNCYLEQPATTERATVSAA